MKYETRILAEPLNVAWLERDAGERQAVIEGYAARFGVWSEDLGGFRERIEPGAFSAALRNSETDVRALFNHDPSVVLGRQRAGTLELKEDSRGLFYRVRLPDTSFARDLVVSMERGDIAHSSFAFRVEREGQDWRFNDKDGLEERTIRSVSGIYDVSPVTFPAYPDASSGVVRGIHTEAAVEMRNVIRAERMKLQANRARAIAATLGGE
jgi:HK97 family phage prohead protease